MYRLVTILLFFSGFLSACDSYEQKVDITADNVLGTYHLTTINGDPVPFALTTVNGTTIINSGAVVLREQQSIDVTLVYSFESGSSLTDRQHATWSLSDGKLFIVHPENGVQYPNNQINSSRIELNSTYPPNIQLKMIFEKQ